MVPGLTVLPLSSYGTTSTALVHWAPGTYFNPYRHFGGEEIFVLDGVFEDVGIDSKQFVVFFEIAHLEGLIFVMTSRFFSSNLSNDGGIVEFAIALLNSVAH